MEQRRSNEIAAPALVAALFLLGALGRWPYGYYVLLRWVVCAAAAYIAFQAHNSNRSGFVWAFGVVAVLFNPLSPIYLNREIWQVIDLLVAALFGYAGVVGFGKAASTSTKS